MFGVGLETYNKREWFDFNVDFVGTNAETSLVGLEAVEVLQWSLMSATTWSSELCFEVVLVVVNESWSIDTLKKIEEFHASRDIGR